MTICTHFCDSKLRLLACLSRSPFFGRAAQLTNSMTTRAAAACPLPWCSILFAQCFEGRAPESGSVIATQNGGASQKSQNAMQPASEEAHPNRGALIMRRHLSLTSIPEHADSHRDSTVDLRGCFHHVRLSLSPRTHEHTQLNGQTPQKCIGNIPLNRIDVEAGWHTAGMGSTVSERE